MIMAQEPIICVVNYFVFLNWLLAKKQRIAVVRSLIELTQVLLLGTFKALGAAPLAGTLPITLKRGDGEVCLVGTGNKQW